MKSLSIKLSLQTAQLMDDMAELNPMFIGDYISRHIEGLNHIDNELTGMCFHYTFKINEGLHKAVKLKAIELNITMSALVGSMLEQHYRG